MEENEIFDVIIIGGSYAGLSAALSLGRAGRTVLVIDSGEPCNKQTPYSHNFLTNDGSKPNTLRQIAREQVLCYPTVYFLDGLVLHVAPVDDTYQVATKNKQVFTAKKVLFAAGIKDTIPITPGFGDCWGISILHCPYCHGYEFKNKKIGVWGNADMGYEMAKMLSQWSDNLTLFTNGTSTLTPEEVNSLNKNNITVVENCIEAIEHENGKLIRLHFKDTEPEQLDAVFTQLAFIQHCDIPAALGVEFTEKGFIKVDRTMQTSVPGIYAAGDCLTHFRSIANAVAQGNKAGATINRQLIEEKFAI
ncbi:NAD(P)/FAD-dependent oxidoreductase [Flavobacterium alkalisoli]|uniref:NAD(P)/FAD-dependent oxidoreductase n=1 Tax=Flavobacterium alkalisoli TaxID=2602769 RepID=UPI003A8F8CF4